MPEELDKSWFPEPEFLPDGRVRMRLPSETEWMLAGGTVRKESHPLPGYDIKVDWRETLERWLSRWQEKTGQSGKAPRSFVRAYEILADIEALDFGIDFVGELDFVRKDLGGRMRDLTKEEQNLVLRFIEPVLEKTQGTVQSVELIPPKEGE